MDKRMSGLTKNQVAWVNEFESVAGYPVNDWNLEKYLAGSISWEQFMDYEETAYQNAARQSLDYIQLLWTNIVEDEGE